MGFWTAMLAILSFFYDLPYMHAVLWITLDILILFFGLALLPATLLLLVLASLILNHLQPGVNKYLVE